MIYIISFPKSGRTWFRTILEEYEKGTKTNAKDHSFTHIGYGYAKDIAARNNFKNRKYESLVLITRDPSDTFVSYYHDYLKRGPTEIKSAIDEYCIGKIADYNKYISDIQGHKFDVVVSYESMISNTIEAIFPVYELLFDDVDTDVLKQAINFCKFDNLYSLEREGKIDMRSRVDGYYKTRKGKVGSAKEELKEETLREIRNKSLEIRHE